MRLRILRDGANVILKALISHEMESGFRKDDHGQTVPAWFIQEVRVFLNQEEVAVSYWGPAVSKNPFIELTLVDVKIDDVIELSWQDSRGASGRDRVLVSL